MKTTNVICSFILILSALFLSPVLCDGRECTPLRAVRNSQGPEKISFIFDFEGKEEPHYRFYMLHDPPRLVVDLEDATINGVPGCSGTSKDSLVKSWSLTEVNFRTLRFECMLNYEPPAENLKALVLNNPLRLAVEAGKLFERQASIPVTAQARLTTREVADGKGYVMINTLELPGDARKAGLKIICANDNVKSRETTSAMAQRTGALAAINGGFFANSGGPLGLVYIDGKLLAPHVSKRPPRTALALTQEGKVIFEKLVAQGNGIAMGDGKKAPPLEHALGGGPALLRNGTVFVTADEEGLGKTGNDITRRAGRTAVAVNKKGNIVLYTVTGFFESHNSGMKLDELALLMKKDQIDRACCLDGGHSTVMVVRGIPVSRAEGNKVPERKVATCLAVFDNSPSPFPYTMEGRFSAARIPADGKSAVDIDVNITDAAGKKIPDGTPVRLRTTLGSVPSITATKGGAAKARLTSVPSPGTAVISAECGLTRCELGTVAFETGEPFYLDARMEPRASGDPGECSSYIMTALVRDRFWNPLPGVSVKAEMILKTRVLAGLEAQTDSQGIATMNTNNEEKATHMRISSGTLRPVFIPIPRTSPKEERGGSNDKE